MRNCIVLAVLLVAPVVLAQEAGDKKKAASGGGAAIEKARTVVDAADKAYNAQDVPALLALLDKSYFGAGPTVMAKQDDLAAAKIEFERELQRAGTLKREGITLRGDEDGDTVWYIADYLYVPKVGPGVLPVRRKIRTSGIVVRRGKEWKIAMWHTQFPQQDPPIASPPVHTTMPGPAPAAPAK
jgi:hypothetical protein